MIKVRSIMTSDVATISPSSGILDAARQVSSRAVSSLVVLDKYKPIGILSEKDIIKGIVSKKKKISDMMDKDFMIISPSAKFSELGKIAREKKIQRFTVVENEKLIGIVTETDIIEATRDFTRFHQIVQEIILAIFGLATAFFLFYFSPLGASILGR